MAGVAARFDLWRSAVAARDRTQLDEREKRARIELATFQLQEIESVAPAADEDERARRGAIAAGQCGSAEPARERVVRRALRERGRCARRAGRRVEARWRNSLRSTSASSRTSNSARTIKSQLEDLAFFLRVVRLGSRRVARTARRPWKLASRNSSVSRRSTARRIDRRARPPDARSGTSSPRSMRATSVPRPSRRASRQRGAEFLNAAQAVSRARRAAGRKLGQRARDRTCRAGDAEVDGRRPLHGSFRPSLIGGRAAGVDAVEFFLSPNPGEELRPLARIASGGELSRIMLALRTLAAPDEPGRTLVFDEVDAGHRRRRSRCGRRPLADSRAAVLRFSASRTCRRLPRARTRTSRSPSTSGAAARRQRWRGSTMPAGKRSSRG